MYRWIEHTSELELELEADSEAGVFAEALRALAELLAVEPSGPVVREEVALSSRDRGTLLADWLGELVFLAETRAFLPERVAALVFEDGGLRATIEGRSASALFFVKAVTYHRLELGGADGRWRARVVLDV